MLVQNSAEGQLDESEKFRRALALLFRAHQYAEETCCNVWDFAVEIGHLRELGLLENDLRYLVRLSFVTHLREVTTVKSDGRQFETSGDLYFCDRTCFVLATRGVAAMEDRLHATPVIPLNQFEKAPHGCSVNAKSSHPVPAWDVLRRILSFNGQTVKQFKFRAVNQETVLSVFEEEGWPIRIDDPLSPSDSVDSKRRLSDTIKCLNRKQQIRLIHFRGDGTGEGVIWESSAPCDPCNGHI